MTDTETITATLADRHGIRWTARDLTGRTDRPHAMGGTNEGLMASEHVLVALASCTTTTAAKIAEKRNVQLDDVRIEASMDFDERGQASAIRTTFHVTSPSEEAAVRKVFELAERACTIRKLLALEPTTTLHVRRKN